MRRGRAGVRRARSGVRRGKAGQCLGTLAQRHAQAAMHRPRDAQCRRQAAERSQHAGVRHKKPRRVDNVPAHVARKHTRGVRKPPLAVEDPTREVRLECRVVYDPHPVTRAPPSKLEGSVGRRVTPSGGVQRVRSACES